MVIPPLVMFLLERRPSRTSKANKMLNKKFSNKAKKVMAAQSTLINPFTNYYIIINS